MSLKVRVGTNYLYITMSNKVVCHIYPLMKMIREFVEFKVFYKDFIIRVLIRYLKKWSKVQKVTDRFILFTR